MRKQLAKIFYFAKIFKLAVIFEFKIFFFHLLRKSLV